ncbi:MAG TPA: hypothetical protein PK250_18580 [Syntrophobacter fumaroxidans]|nr:hypothetical protein [Syntrophobacter fumaroxidans]
MSSKEPRQKRTKVTVEAADTACGAVPHMTVDELAARLNVSSKELYCPACGRIHLTAEDVKKAEAKKYSETERYREISEQTKGNV